MDKLRTISLVYKDVRNLIAELQDEKIQQFIDALLPVLQHFNLDSLDEVEKQV